MKLCAGIRLETGSPGCHKEAMASGLDRAGITGASGCGVTTLGGALAERLDAVHIDTDDHFWVATDPPYQVKRKVPERLVRLEAEQRAPGGGSFRALSTPGRSRPCATWS